jgi:O-acetylserine/cysteine efflux transporter
MGASTFFLGEALPPWKVEAASLVIAGLVINLFWPTLRAKSRQFF